MQATDETSEGGAPPTLWLVDGFNVLHAGLLAGRERGRWWNASQRERLLEVVAGFDDRGAEIVVVFDGRRPLPEVPEPGTRKAPPR